MTPRSSNSSVLRAFPIRVAGIIALVLALAPALAVPGVRGDSDSAKADAIALPPAVERPIDFERDVRPIFTARCIGCHGAEKQRSGFRLDRRALALRGGDLSRPDIIPGDGAGSPLIRRVAGVVEDERMPPTGDPLSIEEIGVLRAWIDQGVAWPEDPSAAEDSAEQEHWAFLPVIRPPLPQVPATGAARDGVDSGPANPIDLFIQARLAAEGLKPSPEADRRTLLRRLSWDLAGLPPTPEEVESFAKDPGPQAYREQVERLLASPRFGERWARHWLDVVRYAETHGFEMNNPRPNAWPYRDYVIRAFNEDKPYDRFVMEQLAGDALGVDAATGFLVAGPWDQVKSPDEVLTRNQRADELHDMINTTGTTFLGLTVGCARCHDHKFDPISQRDYFAFKALLEGVQHGDRELKLVPSEETERQLAALHRDLQKVEAGIEALEPLAVVDPGADATAAASPSTGQRAAVRRGRNVDRFAPQPARFLRFSIFESSGAEPCIDELEVFTAEATEATEGTPDGASVKRTNVAVAAHGTKVTASGTYAGSSLHKLEHLNDGRYGNERSWISNEAGRGWVQLEFPGVEQIDRVVWSRDRAPMPVYSDRLVTRYRIEISTDGEVWRTVATHLDRRAINAPAGDSERPATEVAGVQEDRRRSRDLERQRRRLQEQIDALRAVPRVYAGAFQSPPPTQRFHRGDPMQPREVIPPDVLGFPLLRAQPPTVATNAPDVERRLALARWIASPEHPLTARVIVNRIWQHHFGEGLVSTPSDFGRNGARPSHPELLDWLAAELMQPSCASAPPWGLKHIHRLIVTSATYRQSSAVPSMSAGTGTDAFAESSADGVGKSFRDPMKVDAGNRLLWRFAPRRLDAEPLRDAILATAGLLDLRMGGPGWSPFEPNENYVRVYTPKQEYEPSDFRRMIYATVVRQRPDGVFGAFDCPDGGQIAPRRTRSITPLQALNLLNSGFAIQTATLFAKRLQEESAAPEEQVRRGFQLAFQRDPTPEELSASVRLIQDQDPDLRLFCRALLNANEFVFVF